jgi:hypothetical protein
MLKTSPHSMQKASPSGYTTAQSSVAPHVGHLSLFFIIILISAPLCVSGLGITLRIIAKAALKLNLSGETCHAFTGISASISSSRCTFRPALVVSSPFGAFPSSASRPLRVPMASSVCLLTIARVPLSSFDIYPGKSPVSTMSKNHSPFIRCGRSWIRTSDVLSISPPIQGSDHSAAYSM